jgi:hypothetical protein
MKTSAANIQTETNLKQTDMHPILGSGIFIISILLVICTSLVAQPGLTIYTDAGMNNVSEGLFIKAAALGYYKFGKNRVEAGFESSLKNNNDILLSGYTINASRNLTGKGLPLELQGFCAWTRNSEFLRETNWGALLKMRRNGFEMKIGTNFRTYAFRNRVVDEYGIDKDAVRIHENFNVMYSFGYYLKKADDKWNAGLSVTNIDCFMINQETNPSLCLHGFYKPGSQVCLYAESWYKTSGATNLAINHFGFYFRTGIIWNFN